jgi:hypothetical protein
MTIEIPLTQNQTAMIDDEDFELVSQFKWCAWWNKNTKSFYAVNNTRKATLYMHRLIMGAQKGEQVDHIHHLTLDNRKSELRLCTPSQNQCNRRLNANNTSGYKGVSWSNQRQKWVAEIWVGGKKKNIGRYATPELAHEAYCQAALELHGEFARFA